MQHAIKYLNTYFGWKTTKSLYDKNLDSYSVTFKITSTQSKSFEEFLLEFFSPFLKGSQEISQKDLSYLWTKKKKTLSILWFCAWLLKGWIPSLDFFADSTPPPLVRYCTPPVPDLESRVYPSEIAFYTEANISATPGKNVCAKRLFPRVYLCQIWSSLSWPE